jgi:hypothetical protein
MVEKARRGEPMPCHLTLGTDSIAAQRAGGDWHLDAPVRVPCLGAAEAYATGRLGRPPSPSSAPAEQWTNSPNTPLPHRGNP